MSNNALTWAFAQKTGGGPGRKAVLVALADKADEAHSCYPGQDLLAELTEQSDRSVRAHLKALEVSGFVVRSKRFDEKGHRTSDRYVLPVQVVAGMAGGPTGKSRQWQNSPVADITGGRNRRSLPEENVVPTGKSRQVTQREPSEEPSEERPSRRTAVAVDMESREDLRRVAQHLADRIQANDPDGVRPHIGVGWLNDVRLLLDRDKRPEDKVHAAIDWCQDHEFWKSNIRSPGKLRQQYARLQIQAQEEQRKAVNETPRRPGW